MSDKKKSNYGKYRYPAVAVAVLLTWVFSVTYLVQSNTPEGQVTRLPASATQKDGVSRGVASIAPADDPLLKETYALGINAYLWGSTLVRMEQVSRQYTEVSQSEKDTSYRAPVGEFGHARRLPGPEDADMPTPNQDTLYSSAILDLSQSPMVLSVPAVKDRYYVINVFDMWHNLIQYVGTRVTGTDAQNFLIVPPNWNGRSSEKLKSLKVVRSPTTKVWLWGRTEVLKKTEQDLKKVHEIQDQYKLTPLAEYTDGKKVQLFGLSNRPGDEKDPLRFFTELNEYLLDNVLNDIDKAQMQQLEKIGITSEGFKKEMLTPAQQDILKQVLKDGVEIANAQIYNPAHTKIVNGWSYVFDLDNFGQDYALRSMVAHPYLGGQGEKEAIYPIRYKDSKGNTLVGSKQYRMKFNSNPPNDGFWSITVYDAETKLLVYNALKRYSLGGESDLMKNPDGSFEITFSNQMPSDSKKRANWLAAPVGAFYIITRIYIPHEDVLSLKWKLPEVEPVETKVLSMVSK
ncbi:PF06863 family protein [Halobacteriovorax sp. BALOs_7]|uniref:DUF1254 domain-containing protein n=1 Tax=Halobacteriovorax sp. BALOs_7 TaxID=2109558 RepID=UPI000EA20C92|nr:DUF1254 domain-containing protein [Halobacteriovorax sp. BALOs_7]AYF44576.1 PF06863 family protein [Halobacteriovorax sp. BALOs_7]